MLNDANRIKKTYSTFMSPPTAIVNAMQLKEDGTLRATKPFINFVSGASVTADGDVLMEIQLKENGTIKATKSFINFTGGATVSSDGSVQLPVTSSWISGNIPNSGFYLPSSYSTYVLTSFVTPGASARIELPRDHTNGMSVKLVNVSSTPFSVDYVASSSMEPLIDPCSSQEFVYDSNSAEYVPTCASISVITDSDPTRAATKAVQMGKKNGFVVLAPLGTGASDVVRVAAVESASKSHDPPYRVQKLAGTWYLPDATTIFESGDSGEAAMGAIGLAGQRPLRVMLVGDSMTDYAVGRTNCYNSILATYGIVKLVGQYNTFSGDLSDYTLSDGHHNGKSGAKIEDHTNGNVSLPVIAIATVIGTENPDVIMIQLGTNNVGAGGETATATIAKMQTLLEVIVKAGVKRENIIVSTIPPFLSDATKDRQRILYNTWIWNLRYTHGVRVYDAGGSLVASDISEDLIHPTDPAGYTKLGQAWAAGFAAFFGRAPGSRLVIPRSFATHAAVKSLQFGTNAATDRVNIAADSSNAIPSGGSFTQAFWVYFDALTNGWHSITQYGDTYDAGWTSTNSNTGGSYIRVNGSGATLTQGTRFVTGSWYRVVQVVDSAENTITQYVNGTTRDSAALVAFPDNKQWRIGWGQGAGSNSAKMRLCDWTICLPTSPGFRVPSTEDVWRDYYESTPNNPKLPGISAYYPMHEGAGSIVADYMGGPNGTITGATWEDLTMPGG